MKRLRAIFRCVWHAILPPLVEKWLTGSCHYQTGGVFWTWKEHAQVNALEAVRLATFRSLSAEDREFHKL